MVGDDNGIESVIEADCLTGLPLYRWWVLVWHKMPLVSVPLCVADGGSQPATWVMGTLVDCHFHRRSVICFIRCFRIFSQYHEGGSGLNAAALLKMLHFYDYSVPGHFGWCPGFLSVSSKTLQNAGANDARKSPRADLDTVLMPRDPFQKKRCQQPRGRGREARV